MDILTSYMVKSLILSAVLYFYYQVALRNKKFHSYNRFYLLMSVIISLIIPFANFRLFQIEESSNPGVTKILNIINSPDARQPLSDFQTNWLLFGCSIFISASLLILLLSKIIWIYRIKQKDRNIKMQGFCLIETDARQAPFSFLKNLFWKRGMSMTDVNGEKIFKHELIHIKQHHTYDKLFTQIVLCIFWFNPFYWLIQKELNVIHEFIADSESIKKGDAESFALMLLQSHNNGRYLNPSHSFFHSSIKRRLIMITTSKNTQYSYLRRVLALPIMILIVTLFSCSIVKAQTDPKLNPHDSLKISKVSIHQRNDSIADVAVNYIDANGHPDTLNIAAGYSKNDSAKGNVLYDEESAEKREVSAAETREIVKQIIQDPPKENIYFVDGHEYLPEDIKKLDPQKIKTINVYTKQKAVKRYGDKAKNGAIVFTTK